MHVFLEKNVVNSIKNDLYCPFTIKKIVPVLHTILL